MQKDILISAFKAINSSSLLTLSDSISFSYDYKSELIQKLDNLFKGFKSQGINSLEVKEISCKFCYPNKPAFEFYNPATNELVCRYVIFQESEDFIRVEECSNQETFDPFSKENMPL